MNNVHFCEFRHRLSLHTAQVLEVAGDLMLESANIQPPNMAPMGYPSAGMSIPSFPATISPFPAGGVNVSYGYPSTQPMPSAPGYPVSCCSIFLSVK